MPLNKLDNFIKNTEGRILYVNPNDLDATDSISNQGNSLGQPFKTVQRALLEAARFSYIRGSDNDIVEKTTILLFPGEHVIDNRPGFAVKNVGGTAKAYAPNGSESNASDTLSLGLESNFDLTQSDNILYKFNSINGGVVVPRGTSIVGLDLRKTKIRPKYVPNPTDSEVNASAIFRITGACYFWQFCIFDGNETGLVYTDSTDFSTLNQSTPTFSHHKLTCFEYADGVTIPTGYEITDLDMYYAKVGNAFNTATGRDIDQKYPSSSDGFAKKRSEWEIVGAFASDPINISSIISGDGITPSTVITVTTATDHELTSGTPIKIKGLTTTDYNISTKVQSVLSSTEFTYLLPSVRPNLPSSPSASGATVTIETDTVSGASPYIFNISMRSVWGMNGMHADGSKASGFRSMVVAQFTGVSLQKDDRAFVKYSKSSRQYSGINVSRVTGASLSSGSSSTNPDQVYHLDSEAIYRNGWESYHIKGSNDSFIQIVSVFAIGYANHFKFESGGDASITNSNSNFGQNSLNAAGFKKDAFEKDNTSYITSIISPRAITETENNIDWISLDVGLTISVANSNHLYLYGFTSLDDVPPNLTQGYRVGARQNDKLYLSVGSGTSTANIYMCDTFDGTTSTGTHSAYKTYTVSSGPVSNVFTLASSHGFITGESVKIISSDGDLPENIDENSLYYVIASDTDGGLTSEEIKLASSETNALNNEPLTVYGGSNLTITSRVSDKISGDIGSPIQYDTTNGNWFIRVNSNNEIYNAILNNGVSALGTRTDVTFIKRTSDTRSLDDKIYKVRVVVPKHSENSRNPLDGFLIQESSSTTLRSNLDFSLSGIGATDHNYNRNPKFISTCSVSSSTVTVIAELPHNLNVGDEILVENVLSTTNPSGTNNLGYNGNFAVTAVNDSLQFQYSTTDLDGILHVPGGFTDNTGTRTVSLPRFTRKDLKSNYSIYRSEVISEYIDGVQDGVYHVYLVNFDNSVPVEFADTKLSQNVTNLYPQYDRDNPNENPPSSVSFAKRSPIGEISTNDLKSSLTRETVDKLIKDFGVGLEISSVTQTSSTLATVSFDKEHGLSGIATYSSLTGGSGHDDGTYFNTKLYNESGLTSWDGATAKVVVSGGSVTNLDIQAPGSGYAAGETLYIDTSKIGGSADATITLATSGISTNIGDVVQFTGAGTTSDTYHRIVSIPSKNTIGVAKTAGDSLITADQYGIVVGPSVIVSSNTYDSTTGITTISCVTPHGLISGNKIIVLDSNDNKLGEYLVNSKVDANDFSIVTNASITPRYVLKLGLSANDASTNARNENTGVRDIFFYDNEILTAVSFTSDTKIKVSSPVSGISTTNRFPLGSYIQIDNEIMRVSSDSLSGSSNDEITVIRGVFGTRKTTHSNGSLIRKINPIPIEFRRPTIIRASGHTFEYLGFGPGNYSTSLPQVQIRNLSEKESFLAQAKETNGGTVVYTGMNNNGDFYIGNKRVSSTTGEEKVFDAPIPTVTGEDPSRLSVVFDEVTIKERLLVEGGNSGTVLSQFDGPVTFNGETNFNSSSKITSTIRLSDTTQSTSSSSGSVLLSGGVGIGKNLNVGGDLTVTGVSTFTGVVYGNSGADFGNIQIGITNDQTIDTSSGNLVLDSATNIVEINSTTNITGTVNVTGSTNITGNTVITGILSVTDDITAFYTSDRRLKDNIVPIEDAFDKVLSIGGYNYTWNEESGKDGNDVGVIAQEVLEVLPEAVTLRDNGYYAVDYQKIVPLLIESIKGLVGQVSVLSHKVEMLEQRLEDK